MAEINKGMIGPIPFERRMTGDSSKDMYRNTCIDPGDSYYSVQVVGAYVRIPPQNTFRKLFRRARQVAVASEVHVHGMNPKLPGVKGLNWVEDVKPGEGFSLGFRTMLVDYIPANGTSLSVDFEYIIIQDSPVTDTIRKFGIFINAPDQPLGGILSMDPPRLAAAQAISSIASRVTESLFPLQTRVEALRFSGQWQLRNDLKSSYYLVLSAFDSQELPDDVSQLRVEPVGGADSGQAVLKSEDGKEYRENSYVILEVTYLPVLDDNFSPHWLKLYAEAEEKASDFATFFQSPTYEEREKAWATCDGIIQKARAFADQDRRYLEKEKDDHYRLCRSKCMKLIWGKQPKPVDIDPTWKKTPKVFFTQLRTFQQQRMVSKAIRGVSP